MELDPRIKSIDSIRSFNTDNSDCSGKFGYFTNYVDNFDNLDDVCKGTCVFEEGGSFPFYAIKTDSLENRKFQFFIPEEDLLSKSKEKKYRPYTLQEFKGNLPKMIFPDDLIHFRHKNNEFSEYAQRYNGYIVNSRATVICLGSREYTLGDLFENFEYLDKDGEWNTFGVEE